MASFQDSVDSRFPGAIDEHAFVRQSYDALVAHGFTAENTIACVGVCRDEACRPLVWAVRDTWGEAFNFSSLGGFLTLGTSGFLAAQQHAPVVGGRERYVYFVMPHIGIDANGELGRVVRSGRQGSSFACGALTALLAEKQSGGLNLDIDPDNIEYSLLKRHLASQLDVDVVPDIAALTISMAHLVHEELARMISLTVDVNSADYAVLTGVQIHRPGGGAMIWVDRKYACVEGSQHQLHF